MKKRLIAMLVLTLVATLVAPLAMADHCRKCNAQLTNCVIAASGGKPACDIVNGVCTLTGSTCTGPHPLIEDPLASDFTVVSVERLDEHPQPAASETRVASLETTQTAHR